MSQTVERPSSPAPEASDDLAKAKFCSQMVTAKNAPASGVSGNRGLLPVPSPLRTVHETFTAYGSSIDKV